MAWIIEDDYQGCYQDDDGQWYNPVGNKIRPPEDFDTNSEGYTPFGDE